MHLESTQLHVDLMLEPPLGWLHASLPKIESVTSSVAALTRKTQGYSSLEEARSIIQERRWLELTGVEPANTHFSIIVPVHNEERSLPSFLGALLASEIPSAADIKIIFVVNASSDQSFGIIRNRLAYIHRPAEVILPRSACDPKKSDMAYQVCQNRIQFLVVETPTAGKANALNIGNEIAQQQNHEIAINMDANNWVEPDSVALLYSCAKQFIIDKPGSNVVIVNVNEYCQTRSDQTQVSLRCKTQKAEVTGWMFAWSIQWIHENNGFPQQAIEDYGTGLLALSQKKSIANSEAKIWGYCVANASDENKEVIRFVYGAMQLAQRFENNPIAMQILMEDFPHLRPMRSRLINYISQKRRERGPASFAKGILKWLFNEWLILKARQKLRRDPHGQTWDPIRSTK
jgi:glycosyltransferase involved in cell wall biosynthesis